MENILPRTNNCGECDSPITKKATKCRGCWNSILNKQGIRGMLGRKRTQEWKDLMSRKMKGRKISEEQRKQISETLKNRPKTQEFKDKLKKYFTTEKGKKHLINAGIKSRMSQGGTISKAELKIKDYLNKKQIDFIHQYPYKLGIADFYLPNKNLIIECNGEYWHSLPKTKHRDKIKYNHLTKVGYNILILNSEDIMSSNNLNKYIGEIL